MRLRRTPDVKKIASKLMQGYCKRKSEGRLASFATKYLSTKIGKIYEKTLYGLSLIHI